MSEHTQREFGREMASIWDNGESAQFRAAWANLPPQYAGRWAYDYDERKDVFFVHCGGHRILDTEDTEVADAICKAHNLTVST